ncbi:MAG TPA: DUF3301 domain-containing protein [Casimicrobiaceae bacterium]|jgi:hypothetical protein|nr:DUF3301 domain-containing protein [Casimicrobiaceae bacterium]
MVSWSELGILAAVACVAAFVWDSLRVREAANDAMRRACEVRRLFFLDDTVALESIAPARDDEGRMTLRRRYRFAYSDTGHNRRRGEITLMGRRVVALELEDEPLEPKPAGTAPYRDEPVVAESSDASGGVPGRDSVN